MDPEICMQLRPLRARDIAVSETPPGSFRARLASVLGPWFGLSVLTRGTMHGTAQPKGAKIAAFDQWQVSMREVYGSVLRSGW